MLANTDQFFKIVFVSSCKSVTVSAKDDEGANAAAVPSRLNEARNLRRLMVLFMKFRWGVYGLKS